MVSRFGRCKLNSSLVALAIAFLVYNVYGSASAFAGGVAQPTKSEEPRSSDDATTIGHLAWEITESPGGKILGTGNRDVQMREVQVIYDKASNYLEQRIPLSEGFYLKLNSGREEKPFIGFGMAAGKESQPTFSWEWFGVKGAGLAQKLQEGGMLEFRAEKIGEAYEIIQTHFLSDISMRVLDWQMGGIGQSPKDPTWRVKIIKGSDIEWPTIVGGKVMSAEQAETWYVDHPPAPGFWSRLVETASENTSVSKQGIKPQNIGSK